MHFEPIRRSIKIIFIAVFLQLLPAKIFAMTFHSAGNGGNCYSCSWTVAEGEISYETPLAFQIYVANGGNAKDIVINSTGGNLFAGLELGRLFREYGSHVTVARSRRPSGCSRNVDASNYCPNYYEEMNAGECLSACAYAFLGGKTREVAPINAFLGHPNSRIGFHQFYSTLNKEEKIIEILERETFFSDEQMVSAFILQYLTDMEVEPTILGLASSAGPENMYYPDRLIRKEFKIDFVPDATFGDIDMEPYKGGIVSFIRPTYQNDANSLKQITFFCKADIPLSMLLTVANKNSISFAPNRNLIDLNFNQGNDLSYSATNDITIDDRSVSHRFDGEFHYFEFNLTLQQLRTLLAAEDVILKLNLARVYGLNAAYFEVGSLFGPTLSLTAKNCF